MNWDALALSMWCFCNLLHFVSGSPDSDPPETLEKKVGSKVSKANHTLTEFASKNLQADCFGMVWLYNFLAVSGRQDERRIGTYRNHSEDLRRGFTNRTRSYVCRISRVSPHRCAAICWLQVLSETGGLVQYLFLSVRDSFDSHWITKNAVVCSGWNSINNDFKTSQVLKLDAASVFSLTPTNTTWEQLKKGHGVNTHSI